jgi:hypothetical protein
VPCPWRRFWRPQVRGAQFIRMGIFVNKIAARNEAKYDTKYGAKSDTGIMLSQIGREERAKHILRKTDSKVPFWLISFLGPGLGVFLFNNAGVEVPLVVRVLLPTSMMGILACAIDNFRMRRKLEAAIELLLIQEKRREQAENKPVL